MDLKRSIANRYLYYVLLLFFIIYLFCYGIIQVHSASTPTVVLDSSDNITRTSAFINSHISDYGGSNISSSGFEYGLTTGYGSSISSVASYAYSSSFGSSGSGDGQFNHPYGITLDSLGNIYVVDTDNGRVQKFNSAGIYQSQFGSSGSGDGQLGTPFGIASDASDNFYVTETANNRISIFDSSGVFVNKFGSSGSGDGQLNSPIAITIDSSGNIFVVDTHNHRIQKFDSSGNYLSQFGSPGSGDGQFNQPIGIALDSSDNIFVSDFSNNRIQKFDSSGNYLSQFGSSGSGNGQFNWPVGIYIDQYDHIYVVDSLGTPRRVQIFDSSGNYLSQFGLTGSGNGQFLYPLGITINKSTGEVYVTDYNLRNIQVFTLKMSASLTNLNCGTVYHFRSFAENTDGISYSSDDFFETSPCITPIVETDNAVSIEKTTVTLNGHYAGLIELDSSRRGFEYGKTLSYGQSADENGGMIYYANNSVTDLGGIAFDSSDNIFIADFNNHRIQKFDSSGNYLSQFGSSGSGDGQFRGPMGISIDSSDNIFVIDSTNNRIQKFDSSGVFVNKFGSSGSGDGQFKNPLDIALDSSDNIFVIDSTNNRIQKFDSSGNYLSQFGSPGSGDGQFNQPIGIALDSSDNIFVSDFSNNRIQKFDSSGNYLSQFGSPGSGDGQFNQPFSITLDSSDNIFVTDSANNRIQKFDSLGGYLFSVENDSSPYFIAVDKYDDVYFRYLSGLIKIKPEFSLSVASLDCNSRYYFRSFAENTDGIGYGSSQEFTTDTCGGGGGSGSNPHIQGCTNSDADNYNPNASIDNGSCLFLPGAINGCTDSYATNYNLSATVDNGSCLYPSNPVSGCTNPQATNYNSNATINDGSCVFPTTPPNNTDILGCTDSYATNYNLSATVDNGSCLYPSNPVSGCTNPQATNYNSNATINDGSCVFPDPVNPPPIKTPPSISVGNGGGSLGFLKEKNLAPIAFWGITFSVAASLIAEPGLIAGAVSIPIRLWNLIPVLMGYRRRRRPWGTVYDSVTKQPLDPVYVILKTKDGQEKSTSITDLDGRYGFLSEAGTYTIIANKSNYTFPSKKMAGKTEDELYDNLYFGENIQVEKKEDVIFKNIPMDAINFNWNEFEKSKNKKLMKFYSKVDLFFGRIAKITFITGFISSIFLLFINNTFLNSIILSIYAIITILHFFGIKPRKSGRVIDQNGFPISFGIIRVFSSSIGREVSHSIIGKTGKYYILVPNGKYFIKIQKKTGEDTYEDIYTTDVFNVKHGYVGESIKVQVS